MAERAKGKVAGARKQVGVAPVVVIIPATSEEGAIGRVIDALPAGWFERVIVAPVNPTEYTADVARKFGATVVRARGNTYGAACRAGIDFITHLGEEERPEAVVFLEPDFSVNPEQLPMLVTPVLKRQSDLVIGSRLLKRRPKGAVSWLSVLGTRLACFAIGALCCQPYTDIGPFRAVAWESLRQMKMSDADQGWAAEMQIKASRMGLRIEEVAVDCRPTNKKRPAAESLAAGIKMTLAVILHAIFRR